MGMCLNKKVIAGAAAVGVGVLVLAPSAISAALPLLFLAVCPLSMIFMMRSMSANGGRSCAMGGGKQERELTTTDELAELRSEVQHLRAAHARRESSAG